MLLLNKARSYKWFVVGDILSGFACLGHCINLED